MDKLKDYSRVKTIHQNKYKLMKTIRQNKYKNYAFASTQYWLWKKKNAS